MPARASEAFVLRTYPYGEADLIVSFFTRDAGKLRGAAKRARRPKNPFGSGLERMSRVQLEYFQHENRELVNLRSAEVLQSAFALAGRYELSVALDYIAEISDQLLPPAEPNERYFRLLAAVLEELARHGPGAPWRGITYFTLWAVRLSGFLPELRVGEESLDIASQMLRCHVRDLPPRDWNVATAADLRRALVRAIEQQLERRLITPPLLESLDAA